MSAEEKVLRQHRLKNLNRLLEGDMSPHYLAKRIDSNESYISQLKNGFRPITFDTARRIEEVLKAPHLSLDNPPHATRSVSGITDTELSAMITSVIDDVCKAHNKRLPRDMLENLIQLYVSDARKSGFSEAKIRQMAKVFLV